MQSQKVNAFFVSEKICKVRWLRSSGEGNEKFLSGSWDMPRNHVRLWHLQKNQYFEEYNEYVPKCCSELQMPGDITGLETLGDDLALVGCSDGRLTLLKTKNVMANEFIELEEKTDVLHKIAASGQAAPCTSLSVHGHEAATVGEDGRLNIIDIQNHLATRRSIEADSCALTVALYNNPQEVLVANHLGVIRIFDIRSPSDTLPVAAFMTSCEDDKRCNYVSCLTSYPTQTHIVLAGSEEGSITVWDLRQPGFPASYLSAHTSPITDIGFHCSDPTKLYSATEDGELWQWAQQPLLSVPQDLEAQKTENVNPWLNGERTKNRIHVSSLIAESGKPINTFDTHSSHIICGSDSEAFFYIEGVI